MPERCAPVGGAVHRSTGAHGGEGVGLSNQNGGNDSPTPSFKASGMPYLDINFRCHPAAGALQVLCVHGGAQHLSERLPQMRSIKKTALCGAGVFAMVSRYLIARDTFNLRQPVLQDDKGSHR